MLGRTRARAPAVCAARPPARRPPRLRSVEHTPSSFILTEGFGIWAPRHFGSRTLTHCRGTLASRGLRRPALHVGAGGTQGCDNALSGPLSEDCRAGGTQGLTQFPSQRVLLAIIFFFFSSF